MELLTRILTCAGALGLLWLAPPEAGAKAKAAKRGRKASDGPAKVDRPVDPGPVYKVPVDLERDAFKGNPSALVTWVLFCELQDPSCARFRSSIGKAREYFGADLRVVFKHRPMSWHAHAHRNSEAALCALEHDMFWELHDWLITRRSNAQQKPQKILGHARSAGLTGAALKEFERCYVSRRYDRQVAADIAMAGRVGARGVPNSYINGRMVRGAVRYETMRTAIERELTAARALARRKKLADGDVYAAIVSKGVYYSKLSQKVERLPLKGAAVLGKTKKVKHLLTTFVDLRSSWSRMIAAKLMDLQRAHPDEVTLAARHFPMGRRAYDMPAQRAAACAQVQGRFWELVHALTGNPEVARSARAADWRALAQKANVPSVAGFDLCLTGGGTDAAIRADVAMARRLRARSGSVFLNGRRWGGSVDQLIESLYPGSKVQNDTASTMLARAKTACDADREKCLSYASRLRRQGEPTKRWTQSAAALERGCGGGSWKACARLADTYRDGNGVAFDLQKKKQLDARVCALTKGKHRCPPKPKPKPKPKPDPRYDFFNPGVR